MRTTIDLPDALFRRAKATAARLGVSLRDIVVQGLEARLDAPAAGKPYRFHWAGVDLGATPPGLLEELLAERDRVWAGELLGLGKRRR